MCFLDRKCLPSNYTKSGKFQMSMGSALCSRVEFRWRQRQPTNQPAKQQLEEFRFGLNWDLRDGVQNLCYFMCRESSHFFMIYKMEKRKTTTCFSSFRWWKTRRHHAKVKRYCMLCAILQCMRFCCFFSSSVSPFWGETWILTLRMIYMAANDLRQIRWWWRKKNRSSRKHKLINLQIN